MVEFKTSIEIEARPEIVFAHLVTPERMVTWMGERADLEPQPGGRFAVDIGGVPFRGEYLEVDQPHRVVVSWGMAGSDDFPPGLSRVEFTLEPTSHGTTLHLVHSGLPEARAASHGLGWAHYFARLRLAAPGNPPGADPGFLNSLPSRKEHTRDQTGQAVDCVRGCQRVLRGVDERDL